MQMSMVRSEVSRQWNDPRAKLLNPSPSIDLAQVGLLG